MSSQRTREPGAPRPDKSTVGAGRGGKRSPDTKRKAEGKNTSVGTNGWRAFGKGGGGLNNHGRINRKKGAKNGKTSEWQGRMTSCRDNTLKSRASNEGNCRATTEVTRAPGCGLARPGVYPEKTIAFWNWRKTGAALWGGRKVGENTKERPSRATPDMGTQVEGKMGGDISIENWT